MINHTKYPIIVGAKYINEESEIGILEAAELFPRKNDARIEINLNDCGKYYRLNYSTFCLNWTLLEQ